MAFFLAALIVISCIGAKISGPGKFNTEYLSKRCTTAVNGIFVVLVVFSHYSQYAGFDSAIDMPYIALRAHLGQMAVAPFLFYSGYGMMESIKRKGEAYVRKVPTKFWKLLLRMWIAILLYLALAFMLGIEYPTKDILLAFTLWTAVGNSNWYIFAVLGLYILIYIAFSISHDYAARRGRVTAIAILTVLSVLFVFVLMKAGRPAYCYNTIIIMPLGFIYSEFRDDIERLIMRSEPAYLLTLLCVLAVYIVSYRSRYDYGIEVYTVWAAAFTALFVLITAKLKIYNKVLDWFGTHIFPVYILQRLPMIFLDHFGLIEHHKYICLIVVFVITLPLAVAFDRITGVLIRGIEKAVVKGKAKSAHSAH